MDIIAPRITKEHWPILAKANPDWYKCFDFHVPLDVLARFWEEQDALEEMKISLGLLHESVKPTSLIITQQPQFVKGGPKQKKMPSPEIRDAICMNPSLRKKFSFIVLLNKYDLFAMVREPILIQPTVQEIENLDEMIVICATTQQRLQAQEVNRTVAPPYTLARFPPTFAVPEIFRSAATFGPVDSHQLFQQSGILLIKFQSDQSARASYRATLPGPVYFSSGGDNDTTETIADRLKAIPLSKLPPPVLNAENLFAADGDAPLQPLNLLKIQFVGPVSPVPSGIPLRSHSPASDARLSDGSFLHAPSLS